ncbi:nitrite reductase small subunit NirD [Alteromonas sp. D210916BOD_24]|uniref:nitrite reductase small subunit NirD n=1 Tax=Alteromonas sp. D210916BOD_24 TaxID=3157618 RepID=UPI00399CA176
MTVAQDLSVSDTGTQHWQYVCDASDLVTNSGVCALVNEQQLAIFKIVVNGEERLYAISNYDPIGKANVLYRGLLGSICDAPVVASPLYKEHYFLETGLCKEHSDVAVTPYAIKQDGEQIFIACQA